MDKLLGPSGKLSKILDGFEHRPGQERMANATGALLDKGGFLFV